MQYQRIRITAEILTVIILIFFAWAALRPAQQKMSITLLIKTELFMTDKYLKINLMVKVH